MATRLPGSRRTREELTALIEGRLSTALAKDELVKLASARGRFGYTWRKPTSPKTRACRAWSGFNVDGGAKVQGAAPVTFNSQFMKRGVVMGSALNGCCRRTEQCEPRLSTTPSTASATVHQAVSPGANVTLNTASDKFTDIVASVGLDYKFDIGSPVQTRY